ncbi:MAG: magnesium protoporphyrin IX methyltransferase [Pseudomonadota bacterium]
MGGVTSTYLKRRGELETYFDRTASDAWAKLTSDAPVSGIRATVRAGRDAMRETLLGWLPADLTGSSVYDAGCGTGALAMEAAGRGADVTAIDLSETLVTLAGDRARAIPVAGTIDFRVGDMFDPTLGPFDHVVAMDSVIHYNAVDLSRIIAGFAARARYSVIFTVAPRTPALSVMHAVGQLFPKGDRSPAIQPISERDLNRRLNADPALADWRIGRSRRIKSGFYISHAVELCRR